MFHFEVLLGTLFWQVFWFDHPVLATPTPMFAISCNPKCTPSWLAVTVAGACMCHPTPYRQQNRVAEAKS